MNIYQYNTLLSDPPNRLDESMGFPKKRILFGADAYYCDAPYYYDDIELQNASGAGKRQRRLVAANMVQNLTTPFAVGKNKSKAQPRPQVQIPAKGIGPVYDEGINVNDVLCGRGGRINSHDGNVQFRDMVNATKKDYLAKSTKKLEKAHIAARVVQQIRSMNPPGRFLKEDSDTGEWWDIGDTKAIKKVGQALREDAPDIRHELDEDGNVIDGDEEDDNGGKNKTTPPKPPKGADTSPGKSAAARKNVIMLPTTRSSRRGEDDSPGALPPGSNQSVGSQASDSYEFQQVLPRGSSPRAQVPLPMGGGSGSVGSGGMYPPVAQTDNNSVGSLRHGQFSLGNMGVTGPGYSRTAMEAMNQQQQQNMMMAGAFGRNFHAPSQMSMGSGSHGGSAISGLTGFSNSALGMNNEGTMLSGVSDGVSSLTAGDASFRMSGMRNTTNSSQFGIPLEQFGAAVAGRRSNNAVQQQQQFNMGPSPDAGIFGGRFNNFGNGSSCGGSDLSGQTMPQAAGFFGRTSSHNDSSNIIRDDMSIADHSLMGGGIGRAQLLQQQMAQQQQLIQQQQQQIQQQQQQLQQQQRQQQHQQQQQQRQQHRQQQQSSNNSNHMRHFDGMDASVTSIRTRGSVSFKDGMDFSVMSGMSFANNSIATRSARGGIQPRQSGANASVFSGRSQVSGRSQASNFSISQMSASIASLSLASGASVASFSAHSHMSDFSDTLLALDLAESNAASTPRML